MAVKRTTQAAFDLFKQEFLKWQKRLGLQEWEVVFELEPVHGAYGEIFVSHEGCIATVRLAQSIPKPAVPAFDAVACAKHEALELLIAPLRWLAGSRQVSGQDIDIECHRLIRRLEKLLPAAAEDS